jgi:hypothetical protein
LLKKSVCGRHIVAASVIKAIALMMEKASTSETSVNLPDYRAQQLRGQSSARQLAVVRWTRKTYRILGNIRFEGKECCERWMKLSSDRVQWKPYVSAVLNLGRFHRGV